MTGSSLTRRKGLDPGCGKKRYADELAARLALAGNGFQDSATRHENAEEKQARYHEACGGWHLYAASALPVRKPAERATGRASKPRKPLRPVSKKREQQNRERRAMLAALYPERPMCAVPWCARFADDAHEPLTRARGGSITDPGNVAPLCRPHHDEITFTEPEWAYDLGLLKHSWGGGEAA